jgi:hypothetical protein
MPTFALVTEGPSDQIVIKNILAGYFDDADIGIVPLLPLRDVTSLNRADALGNWY